MPFQNKLFKKGAHKTREKDVEKEDHVKDVSPSTALSPFLNNLFWNGNSFDSCASFAGDVENPAHAFPRALTASVLFVGLGYFVPLLVTLGASTASPTEWVDGYLAKAASDIVGPWLGGWTVFAAGISNIAMFQAELSADA